MKINFGNKLRLFNRFWYERDAIDTYREGIFRSNLGSMRVLSVSSALISAGVLIYHAMQQSGDFGMIISFILLLCSMVGIRNGWFRQITRKQLLRTLYLLASGLYLLAIHGTRHQSMSMLWACVHMGLSAYLLDYAWRVISLQATSYLLLQLVQRSAGISSAEHLFQAIFLACGIVTFYVVNRTRVGLIMSREETRQQADTDLLTGLTIRNTAQTEIEQDLEGDIGDGVLMLLDLDRFKSVNDRMGHQMGDKVLVEVSASLKKMFRSTDVLSRLGGDEFIIYMKGVPEKEWALQRADQVVREVRRWVSNGTLNIQVTASVGIVMTDMVDKEYGALYRAADIAMYVAKARGGNEAVLYSPDLIAQAREQADGTRRREAEEKREPEIPESLR